MEGGCAACPYMRMNTLAALTSICEKVRRLMSVVCVMGVMDVMGVMGVMGVVGVMGVMSVVGARLVG